MYFTLEHKSTDFTLAFQVTADLNGGCTSRHTGTSVAAPFIAGFIALALEAKYVIFVRIWLHPSIIMHTNRAFVLFEYHLHLVCPSCKQWQPIRATSVLIHLVNNSFQIVANRHLLKFLFDNGFVIVSLLFKRHYVSNFVIVIIIIILIILAAQISHGEMYSTFLWTVPISRTSIKAMCRLMVLIRDSVPNLDLVLLTAVLWLI